MKRMMFLVLILLPNISIGGITSLNMVSPFDEPVLDT